MSKLAITTLLKNKDEIYESATQKHRWNRLTGEFIFVSLIGLALFGAVMATYLPSVPHFTQLMWKTIVLVWGSIILCTPSLFVFSAIRGSTIKLNEMVFLLLGALATTGIVLMALAPVAWFFIWTTETLEFVRAMNAFVIGLSLAFGLFFLGKGLFYVHKARRDEHGQSSAAGDVLILWFLLLLVVISQMAHKLAPWYQ